MPLNSEQKVSDTAAEVRGTRHCTFTALTSCILLSFQQVKSACPNEGTKNENVNNNNKKTLRGDYGECFAKRRRQKDINAHGVYKKKKLSFKNRTVFYRS